MLGDGVLIVDELEQRRQPVLRDELLRELGRRQPLLQVEDELLLRVALHLGRAQLLQLVAHLDRRRERELQLGARLEPPRAARQPRLRRQVRAARRRDQHVLADRTHRLALLELGVDRRERLRQAALAEVERELDLLAVERVRHDDRDAHRPDLRGAKVAFAAA